MCARIHDDLSLCDRSHAPAWECSPGRSSALMPTRVVWAASPNWRAGVLTLCLPAGGAFFSLLAQRKETKERAALALRLHRSPRCGTGGAITRCAQTVCPFIRFRASPPGSAPTAPIVPESPSTKQVATRRGHRPWPSRIGLGQGANTQQKQAIGSVLSPSCHLDQRERSPSSQDFSSCCSSKRQTREAFAPKFTAYARPLVI